MGAKQTRPQLTPEERELRRARRAAEAAETHARRWRDAQQRWDAEGLYLTRAEFEAGEPCRGCGLPLLDRLGGFPPQLQMTAEQRAAYDAEEARFTERHSDCHGGRWSMAGSRTLHCNYCCPFPPMSERQAEEIAQIIGHAPPSPASLMVWQLTLTCGHITRRRAHIDHGHYGFTTDCEECSGEVRGVVAQVKIGTTEEVARQEEAAAKAAGSAAAKATETAAAKAAGSAAAKAAGSAAAPGQPERPSKQAVRRKLREAEAQAAALRIQLAQMEAPPPAATHKGDRGEARP
jgi:hypothetical protein